MDLDKRLEGQLNFSTETILPKVEEIFSQNTGRRRWGINVHKRMEAVLSQESIVKREQNKC